MTISNTHLKNSVFSYVPNRITFDYPSVINSKNAGKKITYLVSKLPVYPELITKDQTNTMNPCLNAPSVLPIKKSDAKNDQDSLKAPTGKQQLDKKHFNFHAKNMEKARVSLVDTLLNRVESLDILAQEYVSRIDQGYEPSEILLVKNIKLNPNAVQEKTFVQVSDKQFSSDLYLIMQKVLLDNKSSNNYADTLLEISQVHFLPAFLHVVAARVINYKTVPKKNRAEIKYHLQLMLDSRQTIVEGNIRLVTYVAKQFRQHNVPFTDLLQEGSIGLIRAIDRFIVIVQ